MSRSCCGWVLFCVGRSFGDEVGWGNGRDGLELLIEMRTRRKSAFSKVIGEDAEYR